MNPLFRLPSTVTAALAAIFLCFPAQAQSSFATSTNEDVAIAFFKTANVKPDFMKWAKESREFKVAAPARVDDFLFMESQRLSRRWKEYDPETSLIRVGATVSVVLEHLAAKDGGEIFRMTMSFDKGDVTYFPYEFQDYKFAVVPQKIETLLRQNISREQYDLITTDFKGETVGSAKMELQLKPVQSYLQQPYMLDGVEQWMMLTDTVTLALKSPRSGAALWTYGAEWYVSPVTREVQDLYKEPQLAPAF
ncbi:MAG: hypothetical protein DI626_07505 [Micavibrio aeruginosavorus]|uniref:DUF3108 domain-containing protein n=1 Tax=Micavibrio aeruginosavorus TaxID=349221 RepID=A0A2W5BUU1_9BACT|nr:MAG: hypothetical protein DI626_07505 [Micavibrio aeruginosavorus]